MHMNIMWSILSGGKGISESYARRVDSTVVSSSASRTDLNALVPYTDSLHRAYRIESLVQLTLSSGLRDRALALDPVNLYERGSLMFPVKSSYAADGAPMEVDFINTCSVADDVYPGLMYVRAVVDPVAMTFTYNGDSIPFTFGNSLSSLIAVMPGRSIRLSGALPGASFDLMLTYIGQVHTDWTDILGDIEQHSFSWSDPDLKKIWDTDLSWMNRISAATMSTVENLHAT